MDMDTLAVFRALAGRQILAMDKDDLISAIIMAEKKSKTYADNFPEDEERTEKPVDAGNGVRIIPIKGIISHGFDKYTRFYFGMTETENITQWTKDAITDSSVRAIVFHIDSPGGFVQGVAETAEILAEATRAKPTIAQTSTQMASAAFWLGAAANLIYATPSATVGSIGVFTTHFDVQGWMDEMGVRLEVYKSGENKAAGIGGTSLTKSQKALIQADIDSIGAEFRAFVSAHRRWIKPEAMDGRAVSAKASMAAGMGLVDSFADLQAAIRDAATLATRADKSPSGV